eukprot:m.205768 g.205768  ORF g.205768 m.205768 type:complete len:87 (-) comp53877_c0_seq2:559-819(-)
MKHSRPQGQRDESSHSMFEDYQVDEHGDDDTRADDHAGGQELVLLGPPDDPVQDRVGLVQRWRNSGGNLFVHAIDLQALAMKFRRY